MRSRKRDDRFTLGQDSGNPERDEAAVSGACEATISCSTEPLSFKLMEISSTPTDGAAAWIVAYCGAAVRLSGSVITATRRTFGAISLSNSNHFPPKPNSEVKKPVAFPPGWDNFCTNPKPTGSVTAVNTIGTVRVTFSIAITAGGATAKTTSGARPTSSLASWSKTSSSIPSASLNAQVCSGIPAQILQSLSERSEAGLDFRIGGQTGGQDADNSRLPALL